MFDQRSMHPAVVGMLLSHLHLRKLLAYASALYHPTLRMMEEGEVLARRAPSVVLWPHAKAWADWCVPASRTVRNLIPMAGVQRAKEASRLRKWTRENKTSNKVRKHVVGKRSVFRQLKQVQRNR